jgi:hypothetical protein
MFELILGIFIGVISVKLFMTIEMYFMEKTLEKKVEKILIDFRKNVINSKIEVENGIYFMYNRETNEFLGQATTFEELDKVMRTKYPNKLFNVPHAELMEVMKAKNEN